MLSHQQRTRATQLALYFKTRRSPQWWGSDDIEQLQDSLRLIQPVEPTTGIQKLINIRLPSSGHQVLVEHVLQNHGSRPVELAPWAITQFKTGGEAILPYSAPISDPFGVLPNRNLALWPYSNLKNAPIEFGKNFLRIKAKMDCGAFKVGFPNPSGWLAYLIGRTLFVKRAPYQVGADYFDNGSSSECYCDARFIELESLGPRVTLSSGESTTHLEEWSLYKDIRLSESETELIGDLSGLGLSIAGGVE